MRSDDAKAAVLGTGTDKTMRVAMHAVANAAGAEIDDEVAWMAAKSYAMGDTEDEVIFDTFADAKDESKVPPAVMGVNMGRRDAVSVLMPSEATLETADVLGSLSQKALAGDKVGSASRDMSGLWDAAIEDVRAREKLGATGPRKESDLYWAMQSLFNSVMPPEEGMFDHKSYYAHVARVLAGKAWKDHRMFGKDEALSMGKRIRNLSKVWGLSLHRRMSIVMDPSPVEVPKVDPISETAWQVAFRAAEYGSPESLAGNDQGTFIRLACMFCDITPTDAEDAGAELWLALNGMLKGDPLFGERLAAVSETTPGRVSNRMGRAFEGMARSVAALSKAGFDAQSAALHFRLAKDGIAVPSLPKQGMGNKAALRQGLKGQRSAYVVEHEADAKGRITTRVYNRQSDDTLKVMAMMGAPIGEAHESGAKVGQSRALPSAEVRSHYEDGRLVIDKVGLMGALPPLEAWESLSKENRPVRQMLSRGFPMEVYLRLHELAGALVADIVDLGSAASKATLEPAHEHKAPDPKGAVALLNQAIGIPRKGKWQDVEADTTLFRRSGGRMIERRIQGDGLRAMRFDEGAWVEGAGPAREWVDFDLHGSGAVGGVECPPMSGEFIEANRMTLGDAAFLYDRSGFPGTYPRSTTPEPLRWKGIPADISIEWEAARGWIMSAQTVIPSPDNTVAVGRLTPRLDEAMKMVRLAIKQEAVYSRHDTQAMEMGVRILREGGAEPALEFLSNVTQARRG